MHACRSTLEDPTEEWVKGRQVMGSGGGRFLTLDGEAAVDVGLAEDVVADFEELTEKLNVQGPVPVLRYRTVDGVVDVLNFPFVTGLLLVLGLVFLFVEIYVPGFGIFGILSGLCFTLFFWSHFLGGTAGWLEVLAFVGGVACIAIELFLLPGFLVFGVTGVLLILAGLTLAIAPNLDRMTNAWDTLAGPSLTVAGSLAMFLIVGAALASRLGSLPLFRRMMLQPPADSAEPAQPLPASPGGGLGELIGTQGFTITPLRPAGRARFDDRDVDVVAEGSFIPHGREVRVLLVQGNRVVVREVVD